MTERLGRRSSSRESDEDRRGTIKGNNYRNKGRSSVSPTHHDNNDDDDDLVIKLRGLPWTCTVDDIMNFFKGCKIQGGNSGIHLVSTPEGRSSGEAFVEIRPEDMGDAIRKDKKNIGHRYIEVFKVNRREMDWALQKSRPNHSNSNSSFRNNNNNSDDNESFVRMRGLPFDCTKEEIARFFNGLDVVANGIQLMFVDGRSSGEAYVKFSSASTAEKALQKDRQCIGRRYIELFRVGAAEMRNLESVVSRNSRPVFNNRPGPYDRDRGNHSSGGPNSRYGSHSNQRPARYFSKGFEEDTWNSYANEVGSWNRVNNSNSSSSGRRGGEGGGDFIVLMRGLPFRANESDIRKFFDPLIPMGVHIIFDSQGRPSGSAKVQFSCGDDMTRAMSKHKEKIFTRYIELFAQEV